MKFKKISILLVIVLTIIQLSGCAIHTDNKETRMNEEDVKVINTSRNSMTINDDNVIFQGPCSAFILSDQASINEGKEASFSRDIDNDGVEEVFSIGRDHPNGIQILGVKGDLGVNFVNNFTLEGAFDEFGEPNEGYMVQITSCDLDDSGVDEIVVSIGDLLINMETLVYRVTDDKENPFVLIGSFTGQDRAIFDEDNLSIVVPYGSQGLYDEYKIMDGTRMYSLTN